MNSSNFEIEKKIIIVFMLSAFAIIMAASSKASASGIPLSVIGPHEYTLPVNYESFNAVVEYGYIQNDNKSFNTDGNKVSGPGTLTAVGLTKYVRFFTLKDLPNVGLAWEFILPEISVQKTGVSASGLGDPLTGAAAWIKPTKNSTLGIQSYLSVPIGNDQVSDKTWGSLTTLVGDVQLGNLDICGQTGYVIKSVRHQTGASDVNPGNTFHANLRTAYRLHKFVEPFFAADFQTTEASKDEATGNTIPNSASNETTLGGGMVLNFTDTISLTARYDYGVYGKNTPVTNAFYFKIAYVW